MSQSVMSGFVSDEQVGEFIDVFPESRKASELVTHPLFKDERGIPQGLWFTNDALGLWCDFTVIDGKLHVEIGEGAA